MQIFILSILGFLLVLFTLLFFRVIEFKVDITKGKLAEEDEGEEEEEEEEEPVSFEEIKRNLKLLVDEKKELWSNQEKLEVEKSKLEEKNKKMFAMSEAVYKEKKKVDDENEKLISDKEKLETEKKKVDEKVKKLWNQSTAIHKEKEKINEIKIEIERKHQEIIDSVNYAKRIQEAILPDLTEVTDYLPNSFILYKPKDIVAGDFYWFAAKQFENEKEAIKNDFQISNSSNSQIIIAAVDCTGHGVPGAFMSMIGNTVLNQIVNEKNIIIPGEILTQLNTEINTSLKQNHEHSESRDGMDVAICCLTPSFSNNHQEVWNLNYSGANRPLYIIHQNELTEIKPNKFGIGGLTYDTEKVFNTHNFELQKGDSIYLSTDGFADQFNNNDKKLMTKRFKETLITIQDKTMDEQKEFLNNFIDEWKTGVEQTDDILVIGIKI